MPAKKDLCGVQPPDTEVILDRKLLSGCILLPGHTGRHIAKELEPLSGDVRITITWKGVPFINPPGLRNSGVNYDKKA